MWIDRLIDALRSLRTLFFILGLAVGWLLFADHQDADILYVTVHNTDSVMLESVRFEFGFGLTQSNILIVQIKPGEKRLVALNHPLNKGYNVEAHFAGGEVRSFCANRTYPERHQPLPLQR
ncbi:hypothetical protein FXF61_05775 [Pseudomonas sp. C27(2019)]|uniref:hypothetical protein n=1 Tax=Pseudomonas sp. C27(2019) TaxID=2604941 RepID=UPI0012488637|nr:hypothetical protein [Pseudomonas sp. C27(2019)]QEY58707.1 hypothetical protein FXF61_05775 [Pseudomonas sp. C27(2019)]